MPIRVHGSEDGGGAPGPSTSKSEWTLVPTQSTNEVFFFAATWWARQCAKTTLLALEKACKNSSAPYLVGNV